MVDVFGRRHVVSGFTHRSLVFPGRCDIVLALGGVEDIVRVPGTYSDTTGTFSKNCSRFSMLVGVAALQSLLIAC